MNYMKNLLVIIILSISFIIPSQADDIKDFQIEGISVGDSALNFFSEEDIIKNKRKNSYVNSDGKFYDANFKNFSFFKLYNQIQVNFKRNDKKYIVQAVSGGFFYNSMDQCINKQNEIEKDLTKMFPSARKVKSKKQLHPADKTNRSWFKPTTYYLKKGVIDLVCYDWNDDYSKDKYILISIDSEEFHDWLRTANK